MHDQTAALEWIQANIQFFGGDKHKVRLSSSATAEQLLRMMSELALQGHNVWRERRSHVDRGPISQSSPWQARSRRSTSALALHPCYTPSSNTYSHRFWSLGLPMAQLRILPRATKASGKTLCRRSHHVRASRRLAVSSRVLNVQAPRT